MGTPQLVRDRARPETPRERRYFSLVRRSERAYSSQLTKIARAVGGLVEGLQRDAEISLELTRQIDLALGRYAELITPWARAVSRAMLVDVSRRNERAWERHTESMGAILKREIRTAPEGETLRRLQEIQVGLITSLPRQAAERVSKLAIEALEHSGRSGDLKKEILRTGSVTESRAQLIARTEVGRAQSNLTEARARHVGSEEYIWRTVGDHDVRPSHKVLEGTTHRWDEPPLCDPPDHHAHPGCIWNCRCYAEPILPELF
jgi:SPP1 gp7 family putative phage head morphogenesis protein